MSHTQFRYSASPQILLASDAPSSCYDCFDASPPAPAQRSHLTRPYRDTPVAEPARVRQQGAYTPYGGESTCLYPSEKIKDESGPVNVRDSHGDTSYLPELPFVNYLYEGCGHQTVDARRKNSTKESTGTLKAWLQEHRKNPYPTKGEKIMLAIVTKMTLTQVSTWFANARRRLKKENKMTWSPRIKASEERSGRDDGRDVSGRMIGPDERLRGDPGMDDADLPQSDPDDFDPTESDGSESEPKSWLPMSPCAHLHFRRPTPDHSAFDPPPAPSSSDHRGHGSRIWSLARTATSSQHADHPACPRRRQGTTRPPVDRRLDLAVARVDSPVTTLRNWVDGMFHGPEEPTDPPSSSSSSSSRLTS